jgi:anti-anti-sigma regulatory factor
MALRMRTVSVKQLPETMNGQQSRAFLRELEGFVSRQRPCVVLDCSRVRQMDRSAIHLLLCCLEEAMKRNGDVRLAAVPPHGRWVLERFGVDRLFSIFHTNQDAIDSFRQRAMYAQWHFGASAGSHEVSQNAA